jgi:putative ABC transport system permease protein
MVMKNSYIKDICRTFLKSLSRFLSIFFMAALGAGFFAGLSAVSPNMKNSVSAYYTDQNLMDLRVVKPGGIFQADIDGIASLSCVEAVMPAVSAEAIAAISGNDYVIKLHTLPLDLSGGNKDYINRLELAQGRLPENAGECVVVSSLVENASDSIGIGKTISVKQPALNIGFFNGVNFEIVGIVKTPYYMSYMLGNAGIGSGQLECAVYVTEAAFSMPFYTEAFVSVKGAKSLNQFSKAYDDMISEAARVLLDFSPDFIVLDRTAIGSHTEFCDDAESMRAIATVFPLLFFLVAALVSLTTRTRMRDEERLSIGAYRALGYGNAKIALKYVSYAFLATLLGSLAGIGIGFALLTGFIFRAYGIVFNFPKLLLGFYPGIAALSAALTLAFTLFATLASCSAALRETPAALLQPKAPQKGKRVFLEHIKPVWKRLSFSNKITARNVFLNKKRFSMTVIGVAGCMALLLIGFGLRDSVNGVLINQFDHIFQYDATAGINGGLTPELENLLNDKEKVARYEPALKRALNIVNEEGEAYTALLICAQDDSSLKDFITLRERRSKKDVPFDENSVIVTEKLARELGLRIGGAIEVNFLDGSAAKYRLNVTAVTENYALEYIYVGSGAFKAAFSADPEFNQLFLKTSARTQEQRAALSGELFSAGGVMSVTFNADIVKSFENSFKSLDSIIYVLIISAALLAAVVLYNLTNINIIERKREIATLKVLGFYERETNMYIYRETFLLTLLGIILGIFIGLALFGFVVTTVELKFILIARIIKPLSYILSFALTAVFSLVVNLFIGGKIKKIDMIESLKSVE